MAKKSIPCEIRGVDVEFQGRTIDGVEATCTDCGHTETAGGTGDKSVKRCLALMRENCPENGNNFYVADDE